MPPGEADGRHRLGAPQTDGLAAHVGLYDVEALGPDSPLHLGEVGLYGRLLSVSAHLSEVGVSLEAFDQVLHVGYLEELSEHEGSEIPLGVVFY